jgi:hypothetical protein
MQFTAGPLQRRRVRSRLYLLLSILIVLAVIARFWRGTEPLYNGTCGSFADTQFYRQNPHLLTREENFRITPSPVME